MLEKLAVPAAVAERLESVSMPSTLAEYEQMRVEAENRQPGTLEGLDCPLCLNRGYTAHLRENLTVVRVRCRCAEQRRSLRLIARSGLSDKLAACTFARWQAPQPWQNAARELALDYIEHGAGKWFCVTGTVGAGKTHLCTAICGELLARGEPVRYFRWRNEGRQIKALAADAEGYEAAMLPFKTAKVLYIDDLFKGSVNAGDLNLAFELLDYRYGQRGGMTILSSERTIEAMMGLDEAIGSRVYERAKGYYLRLEGAENWRVKK